MKDIYEKRRKKHTYDFNNYRKKFVFFFMGVISGAIFLVIKKGRKGSISIILNFNEALH